MSYSSTSRSNILRPFAADLWGYGVYILGCPVKALTLTGAKECVFLVAGTCGLNRCRASRDFRDGLLPRSCTRQKHAFVFDCEKEKNCLKVSSARIEQTGDWLYKETVVVRQVPDAAVSWTACRSPAGQETLQHRTLRTAEGEVTENVCPSEKNATTKQRWSNDFSRNISWQHPFVLWSSFAFGSEITPLSYKVRRGHWQQGLPYASGRSWNRRDLVAFSTPHLFSFIRIPLDFAPEQKPLDTSLSLIESVRFCWSTVCLQTYGCSLRKLALQAMSVKKSSEIAAAFCEDGVKSLAVKQLAKGPQERDLFRWNLVWQLIFFWPWGHLLSNGFRCLSERVTKFEDPSPFHALCDINPRVGHGRFRPRWEGATCRICAAIYHYFRNFQKGAEGSWPLPVWPGWWSWTVWILENRRPRFCGAHGRLRSSSPHYTTLLSWGWCSTVAGGDCHIFLVVDTFDGGRFLGFKELCRWPGL